MTNKLTQLQFIQHAIARMSNHSFVLKGWMITIASGLYALAITQRLPSLAVVAWAPTVFIWFLDTYLLWREKQFRCLYDSVRLLSEQEINFSMNPETVSDQSDRFVAVMVSKTMWPFYVGTLIVSVLVIVGGPR